MLTQHKISATLLSLALLSPGCKRHNVKNDGTIKDYLPLIGMALESGKTAALIGQSQARSDGAFGACVASGSLAASFKVASDVLLDWDRDNPSFPAVNVDVSSCLSIKDAAEADDAEISADMAPAEADEEAPAEEAAEEAEEAPAEAEEAAAEEAAAEETEPEPEPEPEPEVEPEPDADPVDKAGVEIMVLTSASLVLDSLAFYVSKLEDKDCRGAALGGAAIVYVRGAVDPIYDEITNPDGKVSIPGVSVDLSKCSEPES